MTKKDKFKINNWDDFKIAKKEDKDNIINKYKFNQRYCFIDEEKEEAAIYEIFKGKKVRKTDFDELKEMIIKIDNKLTNVEKRIESRLDKLENKIVKVEDKIVKVETEIKSRLDNIEIKVDKNTEEIIKNRIAINQNAEAINKNYHLINKMMQTPTMKKELTELN